LTAAHLKHTTDRMSQIPIPREESFEHLSRAPITEAIVQVRGRALGPWDEDAVLARLKPALPEYPGCHSTRTLSQEFQFDPASTSTATGKVQDLGWNGARFNSLDGRYVANFERDSFSLSRLAPYETWDRFSGEALRLYRLHLEATGLTQAQRIGLRFVNQFDPLTPDFDLAEIFTRPPAVVQTDLPLARALFFHQDTYLYPGSPYLVTVVRTLQMLATAPGAPAAPKLILDIDVFTGSDLPASATEMEVRLAEMRWIKNKVFFGSLTPAVLATFR
jgi:uncharacterized protein (TIGR04255 family)